MAVTDCYDQHYGNYYSQDFKSLDLISVSICQKDKDLTECMKDKNFCLESTPDGKHQLKRNHPCFYQVNINNFFLL